MSYVDPAFDTYSLDSCARYGILTSDPCLYLKGTPSPYLRDFYPNYGYKMPNDAFFSNQPKKTNWGKILSYAVALTAGAVLLYKGKKAISKITPDFIKRGYHSAQNSLKKCFDWVCSKFKKSS